jgi:hypothetical protein
MLLRNGMPYTGKLVDTGAPALAGHAMKLAHANAADRLPGVPACMITEASARIARLEQALRDALPAWGLAPVVQALQAMRGVQLIAAMTLVAELQDFLRFESPRQLMAYVGLVPGEHSSGPKRRQGSITKAGNSAVRRMLVEVAWHYRDRPACEPDHRQAPRRPAHGHHRHRLEGAAAAERQVQAPAGQEGDEDQGGGGRGARVGGLCLGHRARGADLGLAGHG